MTNNQQASDDAGEAAPGTTPPAPRVATSVPVITFFFLVVIDLSLRLGNPVDALGFNSVDLWNLPPRIELCKRTSPDVALLGSSLFLVVSQIEKERHYSSGDFPPYLQEQLRKATGRNITCINLCSGLQMPAEAYLIAQAITDSKDHPRVIFWGLTLRDFIDGDFTREWTLTSFQSVAPFVPLKPDILNLMSSDSARREFVLCHFWFLYRNRTDFKSMFAAIVKNVLENFPLDQSFVRLGPDHQLRPQRYGYLWETWVPRKVEKFTEAMYRAHPDLVKQFEVRRQAGIYARGSQETRAVQARYLDGMIALCKNRGVKLVLVNMPLSRELNQYLPRGLNDVYRDYLLAVSQEHGLAFIDLFDDARFASELFKDGVHLSYAGSRVLVHRLVEDLETKHPLVLAAMAEHAAARARDPWLKARNEAPYTLSSVAGR